MTDKYSPKKGDNIPADNFQSVQPITGVAGYLVGGNNPSALSVFSSLGAGANDGKFKININRVEFDNVPVNLSENPGATIAQISSTLNTTWSSFSGFSFTVTTPFYLTAVSFPSRNGTYIGCTVNVRAGQNMAGTILGTKTGVDWASGCTFNSPIWLSAGVYTIEMGATMSLGYAQSPAFTGWAGYNGSFNSSATPCGTITGFTATPLTTSLITSKLQTAIQNATGSTETVIYDTNHFKITSSRVGTHSQILKLMTPSTGTDISGSGATNYFDLGTNATETLGVGLNPQDNGRLIGGKNVSNIEVFKTLGRGANDGKIRINIDGTERDNVPISFSENPASESLKGGMESYNQAGYKTSQGTSFVISTPCYISRVKFFYIGAGNSGNINLRVGQDIAGTIIATKACTIVGGYNQAQNNISFDSPVWLENGTYTLEYPVISSYYSTWTGSNYTSGAWENHQIEVGIYGYTATPLTTAIIAANLQASIRALTSKLETVSFSTDHFIINSVTKNNSSKVLKLLTPSTGTDVSGNGSIKYLDMAGNAIEVLGAGEEDKLIRLDSTGKINPKLLPFTVIPSTIVRVSSDASHSISPAPTVPIKIKEILYNGYDGIATITFGLYQYTGLVTAQVYINGLPVGSAQSKGNASFSEFPQNLAVKKGDLVQLYALPGGTGDSHYFRIQYDEVAPDNISVVNLN